VTTMSDDEAFNPFATPMEETPTKGQEEVSLIVNDNGPTLILENSEEEEDENTLSSNDIQMTTKSTIPPPSDHDGEEQQKTTMIDFNDYTQVDLDPNENDDHSSTTSSNDADALPEKPAESVEELLGGDVTIKSFLEFLIFGNVFELIKLTESRWISVIRYLNAAILLILSCCIFANMGYLYIGSFLDVIQSPMYEFLMVGCAILIPFHVFPIFGQLAAATHLTMPLHIILGVICLESSFMIGIAGFFGLSLSLMSWFCIVIGFPIGFLLLFSGLLSFLYYCMDLVRSYGDMPLGQIQILVHMHGSFSICFKYVFSYLLFTISMVYGAHFISYYLLGFYLILTVFFAIFSRFYFQTYESKSSSNLALYSFLCSFLQFLAIVCIGSSTILSSVSSNIANSDFGRMVDACFILILICGNFILEGIYFIILLMNSFIMLFRSRSRVID